MTTFYLLSTNMTGLTSAPVINPLGPTLVPSELGPPPQLFPTWWLFSPHFFKRFRSPIKTPLSSLAAIEQHKLAFAVFERFHSPFPTAIERPSRVHFVWDLHLSLNSSVFSPVSTFHWLIHQVVTGSSPGYHWLITG